MRRIFSMSLGIRGKAGFGLLICLAVFLPFLPICHAGDVPEFQPVPETELPSLNTGTPGTLSGGEPFILLADTQSKGISGSYLEIKDEEPYEDNAEGIQIADPFEPVNRLFFHFNDKFYFWLMKPVARGYRAVLPEDIRTVIRNIFDNATTPVRFVNNVLQGKGKAAGTELLRFGLNTWGGAGGMADVAKEAFGIERKDEDFGQTLGFWGLGPGIYIHLPVLGPSSLRDTVGLAGDHFLDPVSYITPFTDAAAIRTTDRVNRTSFMIGEYEDLKKDAFDPYLAVKDVYQQYRVRKIKD